MKAGRERLFEASREDTMESYLQQSVSFFEIKRAMILNVLFWSGSLEGGKELKIKYQVKGEARYQSP
jgi:hypothetical protein